MIRQVTHSEPVRLERLDPTIPRDLATIVHKAMAKDPADRYATADELAADLQRYLEDRPIRARPLSVAGVAWRWCRRNPAVASLLTLVAMLLVGIAGVASAGYFSTAAALVEVDRQREQAIGQRNVAEDNLYFANIPLAQQAWKEGNIRKAEHLLGVLQPGSGRPDRRGWEWYYLTALIHPEMRHHHRPCRRPHDLRLEPRRPPHCIRRLRPDGQDLGSGNGTGPSRLHGTPIRGHGGDMEPRRTDAGVGR